MFVRKVAEPLGVQRQFFAKLSFGVERPRRKPKGWLESPTTVSEEIPRARMRLELHQKDIARFLGVKTDTITLSEKNRKIPTRQGCLSFGLFYKIPSQEEFYLMVGQERFFLSENPKKD